MAGYEAPLQHILEVLRADQVDRDIAILPER
jgi:hypothetical protein